MNYKNETLRLLENIKTKKGFEFWDLDIDSKQKVRQYCNNLSEDFLIDGLSIVKLNIEEVARHFLTIEEEQFYIKGVLLKDDFHQYHNIASEWDNNILLTPPTLIFILDQYSHHSLPRIHIHDGKHRLCVYRQLNLKFTYFVIPNSQLILFQTYFKV